MADRSHVRSIDDIAQFRAHFLTFLAGARTAVEECAMEVSRQQAWLESEGRKHWEGEVWRRQRRLEEVKQSLFQETIASQKGPSSFLQMQVHRAERSFDEAHEKLNKIRHWGRTFEQLSMPVVKQIEQLHTVLTVDMARASHDLSQTLSALESYHRLRPVVAAALGTSTLPTPAEELPGHEVASETSIPPDSTSAETT